MRRSNQVIVPVPLISQVPVILVIVLLVISAMSVPNLTLPLRKVRVFHARAREVLQGMSRPPLCPLGLSPRVLVSWLNLDVGSVVAVARQVRETGDAEDMQRGKEWARQRWHQVFPPMHRCQRSPRDT